MALIKRLPVDVGFGPECANQGVSVLHTPPHLSGLAVDYGPDGWILIPPNLGGYPAGAHTGSVVIGTLCVSLLNVYYEIDRDNSNPANFLEILVNGSVVETIDLNTLPADSGSGGYTTVALTPGPCGNKITFNGSMYSDGGQDVYLVIAIS